MTSQMFYFSGNDINNQLFNLRNLMREDTIEDINKAISSFESVNDDFPGKLKKLKIEEEIQLFGSGTLHDFFEPFLSNYCIEKIKEKNLDVIKNLFDKIEQTLIQYPNSYIENGIQVSFLECLWGNYYEFHELYIQFSQKHTLELTLKVNKRFKHEKESRKKIEKKLAQIKL